MFNYLWGSTDLYFINIKNHLWDIIWPLNLPKYSVFSDKVISRHPSWLNCPIYIYIYISYFLRIYISWYYYIVLYPMVHYMVCKIKSPPIPLLLSLPDIHWQSKAGVWCSCRQEQFITRPISGGVLSNVSRYSYYILGFGRHTYFNIKYFVLLQIHSQSPINHCLIPLHDSTYWNDSMALHNVFQLSQPPHS